MSREGSGHTLQPTALVHEAWIRLSNIPSENWKNRSHFLAAAAEGMRRVLVDHARRKHSQKRGGQFEREILDEANMPGDLPSDDVLAINEALEAFAKKDPAAAELVKLRYFVGLTMEEAAAALNLPKRTAEGIWTYARAWLRKKIETSR